MRRGDGHAGGGVGEHAAKPLLAFAQLLLGLLALGDVQTHTEHTGLVGVAHGEWNFDGLQEAGAAGEVRPPLFRDDQLATGLDDRAIIRPVSLGLGRVGHQIEIRFSDDFRDREAGQFGERRIGEEVASGGVLGEDANGDEIGDEAQPLLAFPDRMFGQLARGDIQVHDHRAAGPRGIHRTDH